MFSGLNMPADRLDASHIPTLLVGLALAVYLVRYFVLGETLTLDIVNWSFLTLILLLVRSAHKLIELTAKAASTVGEILLQFPLYAGIGDHLQVRLGGLSLRGEVVPEEDRVGHLQGHRLQRVQAHLAASGDPQLPVRAGQPRRRAAPCPRAGRRYERCRWTRSGTRRC